MNKLFIGLLFSTSVSAQWINTDAYLIDKDSGNIIANLYSRTTSDLPVTAELDNGYLLNMTSQDLASRGIKLYWEAPDCQGQAYIANPKQTPFPDRTIVGTYLNPDNIPHTVIASLSSGEGDAYIMQSFTLGGDTSCINAQTRAVNANGVLVQGMSYTPQLEADPITGDLQFKYVNHYATGNDANFPAYTKSLSVKFDGSGKLYFVENKTDESVTPLNLTVEHEEGTNFYDIHLGASIIHSNYPYQKMYVQCSINYPSSNTISNYKVGCFKVNGQGIIRVITDSTETNVESPISVDIKW